MTGRTESVQRISERKAHDRRNWIVDIMLVLLIFAVHVWGVWNYDGIIVLPDEFGYWQNAAGFAGYDWTGVMAEAPWYSFGYSLLLVPLFGLCTGLSSMYHLAVLLNGILMAGVYFIARDLTRRLWQGEHGTLPSWIAAAVCFYPAYAAQSRIAWAEITVYFFFWLLVWCFLRFAEEPKSFPRKTGWGIAVSVLAGVCYMTHNRMIVIIIALLLTAVLMKAAKRITWKQLLALVLPAVLLYILNGQVKIWMQGRLAVDNGPVYGVNDIASRVWRLKAMLSPEGIGRVLRCALGELVYVNLATFTVGIIGIYSAGKELIRKGFQKENFFFLFVLLAFLGEWGISTLVNTPFGEEIGNKSLTYLYYGRYVDAVTGIMVLLGMLYLLRNRTKLLLAELLACHAVMIAGAAVTDRFGRYFSDRRMKSMCVPGIWYLDRTEELNVVLLTIGAGVLMLAVTVIYHGYQKHHGYQTRQRYHGYQTRQRYHGYRTRQESGSGFCIAVSALFLAVGISYSVVCMGAYREHKEGIFPWLEKNTGPYAVYCMAEGNAKYYTQAALYYKKIRLLGENGLELLGENSFVIAEEELEQEHLRYCTDNGEYFIYVTGKEAYEKLREDGAVGE